MKYFLPELYVQLNSPDEAAADAAEEAIDRASQRYNRRWEEIKPLLPATVVRFYQELNLHDADVLTPARLTAATPLGNPGDVVLVAQQVNTLYAEYVNTLAFLHYVVSEVPHVEVPVRSNVFNRAQPIWMYDEFDVIDPGLFVHSILLSDGRVITIRFRDFCCHLAPLVAPDVFRAPSAPQEKAISP